MTPTPPATEPDRSAAAARMRRYRVRRRYGLRVFAVEFHDRQIDGLIRRGLLKPEERGDPEAFSLALHRHLARTLPGLSDA